MDYRVVRENLLRKASRVLSAALVLNVSATGFARAAVAQSLRAESAALPIDSIWYVTNRAPSNAGWSEQRGALTFGVRTFRVSPAPGAEFPWSADIRKRVLADSMLPQAVWSGGVQQSAQHGIAAGLPVLVYVHGFATSFVEATEQAAELRRRGDFQGPVVVFSWPAGGSGLRRPTLDRPLTNAYWRDNERATESIPDLAVVLQELVQVFGAARLVVASHSMGSLVVDGALRDHALSSTLEVTPLRTLAFLSPDVDATYFADSVLSVAKRVSSRQVLYGSRNDRLLQISAVIHGGARAGQLRQRSTWVPDLEVVDVTNARVAGNWWVRQFGTNHAMRRRPDAVYDLFQFVLGDVPAACRAASGRWVHEPQGPWRLQRTAALQANPADHQPYADCSAPN